MKERIMKVLAVLALLAALGACNLLGGDGDDSSPADQTPPTGTSPASDPGAGPSPASDPVAGPTPDPTQPVPTLDAVTGILPADNTATDDASITLSWNAVSEATGYEVQLAETEAGVPTAQAQSVSTTSFDPTSASEHFWYWRVRAVDGDQFGPWSAISSFTVGWTSATIPSATVFGADATTNVTDDTTPTFQWDPVPGAVRYELTLPSDNQTISVTEPTYTLDSALLNDTNYTWSVRAVRTVDGAESFTAETPATFRVEWGSNGPADGFRFAEELVYLRNAVNDQRDGFGGGIYRLGGDIDLTPSVENDIGPWTPIGTENVPFTGTFDGAGYTITGVTTRGHFDRRGFFGFVSGGGHITNVTLRGVDIKGRSAVGGLVGLLDGGTVSGSSVTGQVEGRLSVGGLVGTVDRNSTVSGSYAAGEVSGEEFVGGLVGTVYRNSTVSDSYATASTRAPEGSVGGLVGVLDSGTVSHSYAIGAVPRRQNRGGLVGVRNRIAATVSDSFYDRITTGQEDDTDKGVPKTTDEMRDPVTFTNWDFDVDDGIWAIDPTINNGYPYLRVFTPQ